MLSAGLTAEIVMAKINSSRCDFDTSPDALTALKSAKVPDDVILAMVKDRHRRGLAHRLKQ
jgi:hypothetical protein